MADNRNFAALDWLIHEIGETLKEARQALEAYVENPKDAVRIRFCLTHIHQVHGSLQMVEFFGAAMLAEEMEKLTQAMIQGTVGNTAEAQEVLMRAILQFPVYLDQVKTTRKDNPLVVLPLLNDLRAVRGESLFTDTKLFVPNLAPAKKVTGIRSHAAHDNVQFQSMALKLRQMYQYAAAGYIRSVNSDENLAYLQKAFNRLHKLTQGTARHALWDICLALAEALEIDALEMSVAIKNLLRQLDKEIKVLAVHGTKALNSYTNDELIKNLLYYVARAGKHAPSLKPDSHLRRVYETYHLDEALIEGKESGDDTSNILSAPDPEAMRSVVEALKTELDIIKHALDVCLSGGDSQSALNDALPVVKRIGDTMAVLGLGDLRKQVLEQGAALEMVANSDSQLSQDQLMSIASKVIEIEDSLDSLAQQQTASGNNDSPSSEGDITLTRAKESVLRESRNGLEHAKDAIIEYIASQWDRVHLQNVPETLREIRGGLEIMPLPRAARILGACARYIEEQLLVKEFTPQWSSLDTLADAITSVEYYLERLSGGSSKEENDLLLTVAEESVAALGYAVAKVTRADLTAAELNAARLGLSEPDLHTTFEAAADDEANLAAAYESALQGEQASQASDEDVPGTSTEEHSPNLLKNTAPSIGNHYPYPETRILVSTEMLGPILSDSASRKAEDVAESSEDDEKTLSHAYAAENISDTVNTQEEFETASSVTEVDASSATTEIAQVIDEDDDNYIDDEIIEIFVEEAGEVLGAIAEYFPIWAKNFEDGEALTEFRRAFHTLKGSGRMVGATDIGELAWSIENMLNRVLDKTIEPGEPHVLIIEKARAILPDMIAAFSKKLPTPHLELSLHYRDLARALAEGEVPAELIGNTFDGSNKDLDENDTIEGIDAEYDEENYREDDGNSSIELGDALEDFAPDADTLTSIYSQDAVVDAELDFKNAQPVMTAEESTDDSDGQLWDIFGAEAQTHLQTLEEFITHMEAEAPVYEAPSDAVQRALHTLKGSAHMAEITPIAELAAPLEKFVKELRSYHVVINDDMLQLLRDAVTYTQAGLAQIERGEIVAIPRLHQFTARVHELREIHVAPLVRQQELDENGKRAVDPELLSIFMAEEMNLLLNADNIIAQWQTTPSNVAVLKPVLEELRNLNRGAHHAYLPIMASFGEKLEQVYSNILAERLEYSDSLCTDLNSAHVALLDMVDAIAAGQNLAQAPQPVVDALDDLLAAANANVTAEPEILEQLATSEFENVPKLDEYVEEINSELPLAEADYEDVSEEDISLADVEDENVTTDDALASDPGSDIDSEEIILSMDDDFDLGEEINLDEKNIPTLPEADVVDVNDLPVLTLESDVEILDLEPQDELDDAEEITLELPDETSDISDSEEIESVGDIVGDIEVEDASENELGDEPDQQELGEAAALENVDDEIEWDNQEELEPIVIEDDVVFEDQSDLEGFPALEDSEVEILLDDDEIIEDEADEIELGLNEEIDSDEELVDEINIEAISAVTPAIAAPPIIQRNNDQAPPIKVAQRSSHNDVNDEDYDPEIIEIFIEEAAELLEDMERALHEWQEDWTNTESVEELKRCLHTFKGGARLAGLSNLGDLSHDYETMLIEMDADAELDQNFFKQLNTYQDQLHSGVDAVRNGLVEQVANESADTSYAEADEEPLEQEAQFEAVDEEEQAQKVEYSRPSLVVDNDRRIADLGDPNKKPNVLTFAPKPKAPSAPLPKIPGAEFGGSRQGSSGPAQVQHLAARRAGPQEVVKVSAELLEELVNLAGETSISRGRMEQQVSDLGSSIEEMDATIHRLQEQLRRLDIETEAQVLFRQEQMMQHEQFDPLEMDRYSQLQQLSRSLIESASDLMDLKYTLADKTRDTETLLLQQSRINTDLQEGLMRSRMVPFSRLVPRLRRIVRQAATELGKEVEFELDNVEGELDRTVLERMVAPLEHMLRNAVDHGIESPEARSAAGKPVEGRIVLSLGREGGDVMLRLADDGRGINLQRVREKAIERGLMAEDAPLSDQDLMQFILHAGFSTADKVTQISGRGVGMDVVHSEIKQLGGAMFIDSRWGEGTEFTIRLPFTVSVNRALMVQIGDDLYAIPLNTIEGIVRVSPFELEHYYQDPDARFDYAGDNYLVRYLGNMLDSDAVPKLDGQSLPLPVILVRSTENTVALQVDRLLGSREIVVKTLGAQFSSVRGVSGATVTGDGSVVVILDLHALIREQLALGLNRAILLDAPAAPVEEEQVEKVVMVVDDSVTVRKVTGRFLEREGFRVITAKDGVEALQLLQDHIPDVMLLDIEMPRMDGFEVAKNVRTSSRLRDIPIIMITSRTGEKHREHAFELGVNKYMGKPYQEDLLLSNIQELIKSAVKNG
ncbi:MAG: response regulator [Gammaproteobacteria bacterium]|nr:MAG: response regulator [Gammaproteobacteria bacterium]